MCRKVQTDKSFILEYDQIVFDSIYQHFFYFRLHLRLDVIKCINDTLPSFIQHQDYELYQLHCLLQLQVPYWQCSLRENPVFKKKLDLKKSINRK
jgi:hypothetical protein